jgi:hypothetical protein
MTVKLIPIILPLLGLSIARKTIRGQLSFATRQKIRLTPTGKPTLTLAPDQPGPGVLVTGIV